MKKYTTNKKMPLDAYLNSEADELATIGLKRLQENPKVPLDPDTVIQFQIKGRTITRKLQKDSKRNYPASIYKKILLRTIQVE
jgi:hypothetical protein